MSEGSRELPADIKVALAGFTALGALFQCADQDAWASLARPPAAELGVLIQDLNGRLGSGLERLGYDILAV